MSVRCIIIMGGTFDPPHLGHINSADRVKKALNAKEVWLIPTYIPPHKQSADLGAKAEDRLAMTERACEMIEGAKALDIEVNAKQKSYTIDTLEKLTEEYPEEKFVFLLGTDMLTSFEQWKDFEKILSICPLAVYSRETDDREEVLAAKEHLEQKYGAKVYYIEGEAFPVSSTKIREMHAIGQDISGFVSEGVLDYIEKNGLYKDEYMLSLSSELEKRLSAKRFRHSLGVEETAVSLAGKVGADVRKARIAGLMHDVTKELSNEEHLRLMEENGLVPTELELSAPKLFHAMTAPFVLKNEFHVDDEEILSAVRYHTTGRKGMSLLEKVIYMADFIEPNRDFEGVEELRQVTSENFDEGVKLAFRMSVEEVEEKGGKVHPDTINALKELL